jgi:hypothetical protein
VHADLNPYFDQISLDRSIFSYYDNHHVDITIHPSARKHGILDADIRHAMEFTAFEKVLEFSPTRRVFYLGSDRSGNVLELVAIHFQGGNVLVIHAMRMTNQYQRLFWSQYE